MNLSYINPYIRVAMQSVLSDGHHIARRVIYDYELIYLERGEFTLLYNDVPYHCSEGDWILIRPGVPHSFRLESGEISQPHIHFDLIYRVESHKIPVSFKDRPYMTEEEKGWIHKDYFPSSPDAPFVKIRNKRDFLDLFYSVISERRLLLQKSLMLRLLSELFDSSGENFSETAEEKERFSVADEIRDYMDAGNGLKMNLDDFAKSFYHSKFYLEKKFKETCGCGLIEYRNIKRMEYADQLLAEHSVSRVAEELGYPSIYSFSRAYKRQYGYPPTRRKKR